MANQEILRSNFPISRSPVVQPQTTPKAHQVAPPGDGADRPSPIEKPFTGPTEVLPQQPYQPEDSRGTFLPPTSGMTAADPPLPGAETPRQIAAKP